MSALAQHPRGWVGGEQKKRTVETMRFEPKSNEKKKRGQGKDNP